MNFKQRWIREKNESTKKEDSRETSGGDMVKEEEGKKGRKK